MELSKFGKLEGLYIADNMGDHMIGHVYARFWDEEEASDALQVMNGRLYDGRPIQAEFSPVTDFREARCRDFDENNCQRGGFCNFLHVKPVPLALIRSLEDDAQADRRAAKDQRRAEKEEERRRRHERKRQKREREDSDRGSRKRRHREDDNDDDDSSR